MHAERIAREQRVGGVVEGEHGVRPVQVGSDHELQLMPRAEVDLFAVLQPTPCILAVSYTKLKPYILESI